MTLATGTPLNHGTYVIDAWVSDDTVGPMYLAMDVPRGQWVQLRVLGSRDPAALPVAPDRQAFYQYLDRISQLGHPALPTQLRGFEEEAVCYQILTPPLGMPLTQMVTPDQPLPPRVTLSVIRQVVEALEILRPLGWAGLRLTPDQVWYHAATGSVVLTGFDLAVPVTPSPPEPAGPAPEGTAPEDSTPETLTPEIPTPPDTAISVKPPSPGEASLVQQVSHLLYFLLLGRQASANRAPLAVDLRQQQPHLPLSLDRALTVGSPTEGSPTVALPEWLALLPAPEDLPLPPPSVTRLQPQPTAVVARPQPASQSVPGRSPGAIALGLTGLVATVSGLGFGLYARLQPNQSTSQEWLNPNQSFPPLPNWSGDDLWRPWDDAPALRPRPRYGDTPPPDVEPAMAPSPSSAETAAPPPAVTQPLPTAPPSEPEPVEPWRPEPDPVTPYEPSPAPIAPAPIAPAPIAPAPIAPPPPLELPPQIPTEEGNLPSIKAPTPAAS
jgi:hypothetical protein